MARGGFQRKVRVDENGAVIDHRPLNCEDDQTRQGTWLVVDVPTDIPVSLNDGISARCLTVDTRPEEEPAKEDPPVPGPAPEEEPDIIIDDAPGIAPVLILRVTPAPVKPRVVQVDPPRITVDGRLTWPADAPAQVEQRTADLLAAAAKVPTEAEVVAEALALTVPTKQQIENARAELVAERRAEREGK